jgi:hypothetical protein
MKAKGSFGRNYKEFQELASKKVLSVNVTLNSRERSEKRGGKGE